MPELQYKDLFGTQIDVGDIMLLAKNTSAAEYSIVPFRVLEKTQRNSQDGPAPVLVLREIELVKREAHPSWPEKYTKEWLERRRAPVKNWTFQRGVCLTLANRGEGIFGEDTDSFIAVDKGWEPLTNWAGLFAAYEAAADPEAPTES